MNLYDINFKKLVEFRGRKMLAHGKKFFNSIKIKIYKNHQDYATQYREVLFEYLKLQQQLLKFL